MLQTSPTDSARAPVIASPRRSLLPYGWP
ncbi:MAG: hypothetical protein QOJ23_1742, partial [Actinomycetota bacterium]|nr:hypothetical protein [Actinomycetota bacterium]